jgi:hypothetical protein
VNTRLASAALTLMAALVLGGCAAQRPPAPAVEAGPSPSTEASRALGGDWLPSDLGKHEVTGLSFMSDGSVFQWLGGPNDGQSADGTWTVVSRGVVEVRAKSGASATYRLASTRDTTASSGPMDDVLTLTWVQGSSANASRIARELRRYESARGDSWVTGSRKSLQLVRPRTP